MELIEFELPETDATQLTKRGWDSHIKRGEAIRAHFMAHFENDIGIEFKDRPPPEELVKEAGKIFQILWGQIKKDSS